MMEEQIIKLLSQNPERRTNIDVKSVSHWLRRRSSVLYNLSSDVLHDIIKNCGYKQAKSDDVIIKQGDLGESFYILLTGRASVYITTSRSDDFSLDGVYSYAANSAMQRWKGRAKVERLDRSKFGRFIMYFENGKSFGELALICKDSRRKSTIIADEVSHLIVLPRDLFNRTLKDHLEAAFRERSNFINNHPWFKDWNPRLRRILEMSLEKMVFSYGEPMLTQGDRISGLMFILSGEAKIVVNTNNHATQFSRYLMNYTERNRVADSNNIILKNRASSPIRRDKSTLELCLVDYGQVIGDIELTFGLEQNTASANAMATTHVLLLNRKYCDRLILKKNPRTLDVINQTVFQKLYVRRDICGNRIPLYHELYQQLYIRLSRDTNFKTDSVSKNEQTGKGANMKERRLIRLFLNNQSPLIPPYLKDSVNIKAWSIWKNQLILRDCKRNQTKTNDAWSFKRSARSTSYLKNNIFAQQRLLCRPITATGTIKDGEGNKYSQTKPNSDSHRPKTANVVVVVDNSSNHGNRVYKPTRPDSADVDYKKVVSVFNQLDYLQEMKEERRSRQMATLVAKENLQSQIQHVGIMCGNDDGLSDIIVEDDHTVESTSQSCEEYLSSLEMKMKRFCKETMTEDYRPRTVSIQSLKRFKVERSSQIPKLGGTVLVDTRKPSPGLVSSEVIPVSELLERTINGEALSYSIDATKCSSTLPKPMQAYSFGENMDAITYNIDAESNWFITSSVERDVNGSRFGLPGPAVRVTLGTFTSGLSNTNFISDRNPATGQLLVSGGIGCYSDNPGSFTMRSKSGNRVELSTFSDISSGLNNGDSLRFDVNVGACDKKAEGINATFGYGGSIAGYRYDSNGDVTFTKTFGVKRGYYVMNAKLMSSNMVSVKVYYVDHVTKASRDNMSKNCALGSDRPFRVFKD